MTAIAPSSTSGVVMGRSGKGTGGTGTGTDEGRRAAALGALPALVGPTTAAGPAPSERRGWRAGGPAPGGVHARVCPAAATAPRYALSGTATDRPRSGAVEGYDASTYGDGFADVYDDWYAGLGTPAAVAPAVEALAAMASQTPGPVLELGVGSGRLALPLAARGFEVWGVDASAAMIERLRRKPHGDTVKVVVGDIATLDLTPVSEGRGRRFGLVFVANNTFFNLPTEAAQCECLRRARRVLEHDGRFVIEAVVPDMDPLRAGAVEARRIERDRVVLSVSLARSDDPRVVDGQHVEISEQGIRLRPWMVRLASPAEIDAMAGAAGLRLVERWASWDGDTPTEYDPVRISIYQAK
jgi:SAM-dependent methyltransferase